MVFAHVAASSDIFSLFIRLLEVPAPSHTLFPSLPFSLSPRILIFSFKFMVGDLVMLLDLQGTDMEFVDVEKGGAAQGVVGKSTGHLSLIFL